MSCARCPVLGALRSVPCARCAALAALRSVRCARCAALGGALVPACARNNIVLSTCVRWDNVYLLFSASTALTVEVMTIYGNQSYSKWFGAPKTLDVLIERVVPLLNDGYQNKPFGGVWTPNGAFLTLCSFHIFVRESLCLSVVSFFYIKLETTCRSILHAYPKLVKFPLFQTSEISLVVTNSPCHWKFTKIYWKIMTTCLWILLRFTNFNKSSTEISFF